MDNKSDKIIIRQARREDMPAINGILNYAVMNTNYNLNTSPRSEEKAYEWYDSHVRDGYPVVTAELGGKVIGWASLSRFREYSGYNTTAEVSVYVSVNHRHKGVGTTLLTALQTMAQGRFHCLIAVVTDNNWASLALHTRCGFIANTTFREIGYKNNTYIDITFMTKLLDK
ncbi:MAG: N-acetyltransferase [Firmicutes bacterium]|nr:N-acetyltransferase [Bacillota bacterium]